jgi:hypothetical protein
MKFITRFQRFNVYKIVKDGSSALEWSDHSPLPPLTEGFRWDSQLFPPPIKPKPHLQTFYECHNRNVHAFQALLDDPTKCNTSMKSILGPYKYQTYLQTDSYLHFAASFVTEVESQLPELLLNCREMYVNDKLDTILGPYQSRVFPDQRGIIVVPEYTDSDKQSSNLFCGVNQWTLTESNWKPIAVKSQSDRYSLSNLKANGVLTKSEAIIMAFLDMEDRWNRFHLLIGDTCKVKIDTEKGQVTVECLRWGNYCTQKVLILPRSLKQPVGEGSHLYFMLRRVGSRNHIDIKVFCHNLFTASISMLRTQCKRPRNNSFGIDGYGQNLLGVNLYLTSTLVPSMKPLIFLFTSRRRIGIEIQIGPRSFTS